MVKKIDDAKMSNSPSKKLIKSIEIEPDHGLESLKSMIFDSPDINQAKIDFLKEEIATGRYEIEPANIAVKITEPFVLLEAEAEPA